MGFINRFVRVMKSGLNSILGKAEKPERMLNQLIIDMNEQLKTTKISVANAIADEKKLERQLHQYETEAEEWEKKAILAVKAGKDDLAKEALVRQKEALLVAAQYKEQWEAQHDSVEKLKQALRGLSQKIDEAKREKNLLLARSSRVQAQQQIQNTLGSLTDNSAFESFKEMSAKIDDLEARVEAQKELQDFSEEDSIEKQFKDLEEPQKDVNLMLDDLKKKIAGELEEPK